MNYKVIYEAFIADRSRRKPTGYVERHHILPKSLGGCDDAENVILLSAGDHYFAHLCLAKIHGRSQWAAVHCMASMATEATKGRSKFASRYMVAVARKRFAIEQSARYKGQRRVGRDKVGTVRNTDGREATGSRTQIASATGMSMAVVSRLLNGTQAFDRNGWYVDRDLMLATKAGMKDRGKAASANVSGLNALKVQHIATGRVYQSLTEAANENGTDTGNISRAIRSGGQAAGSHWAYV